MTTQQTKFRIGDIVRPIPGCRESKSVIIDRIEEMEVISLPGIDGRKRSYVEVRITKGTSKISGTGSYTYGIGKIWAIEEDCLELVSEEAYEIY